MATEVLEPTYDAMPSRVQGGGMQPTPTMPQRSLREAFTDPLLDTAAGFVRTGRGIAGAVDTVQTAIDTKAPTEHPKMDAAADIEKWILGQRSANAQYLDDNGGASWSREPGRAAVGVATGILPYAPLAALGPVGGAIAAGAIAAGGEQAADLEEARSGNMDNNSQYLSLIQSGMSDKEARARLGQIATDPTQWSTWERRAPAIAGNMMGWGMGISAARGAMRSISTEMVDKIIARTTGGGAMRATATGAGVGAATGIAQGSGTDYSRQASRVAMGQQHDIDWGENLDAATESGAIFGVIGGAGRGVERLKELRAKRASEAPPIGTDVLAVAGDEAHADQPMPGNDGPDWNQPGAQPGVEAPPAGQPASPASPGRPGYTPAPRQPGVRRSGTFGPTKGRPDRPEVGGDLGEVPNMPGFGGEHPFVPGRAPEPFAPRPDAVPEEPYTGPMTPHEPLAPSFPEIERPGLPGHDDFPVEPEPPAGRDAHPGWGPPPGDGGPPRGGPPPAPTFTPAEPAAGRGRKAKAEAGRQGVFGVPEENIREHSYADRVRLPGEEPVAAEPSGFRVPQPGERAAEAQAAREREAAAAEEAKKPKPPPIENEEPTGAPRAPGEPKFAEIEKPGRPKVREFGEPVEAKLDWRDRDRIEKALVTKDANTRNQWANRLQRDKDAGKKPSLDVLPVLGQRMLGNIREHIDRMMKDHPQATIDAIRGRHTEEVPGVQLSAEHKAGLSELKKAATEGDITNLNAHTYQMVKGENGLKRILWNRLPKTIRDIMDMMPKETKRAIVEAYTNHAREAVDYMHGIEHKPEPAQYRHKGEPSEGDRIAKLEIEEKANRPEEGAAPEANDGQKPAAPKREKSLEEIFAEIADDMPKEPSKPRSMEDLFDLNKKPQTFAQEMRSHMLYGIGEAKRGDDTRKGSFYQSLTPLEQHVLDVLQKRLEKDVGAKVDPMQHVARAFQLARNADVYYREFTKGMRDIHAKRIKNAKSKAEARAAEYATREDIVWQVMNDKNLGIDTLADSFTVDPVTKKQTGVVGEGVTVRQLLEKLIGFKQYAIDGTTFNKVPPDMMKVAAKKLVDLGRARLVQAEKLMQEQELSQETTQIGWGLPTQKHGVHQWYNQLANIKRLVAAMERYSLRNQTHKLGGAMINYFNLERAIQERRLDHFEKHVDEQTAVQFDTVKKRLAGLTNRLVQLAGYEDTIISYERKFAADRKHVFTAEQAREYTEAKKNFKPDDQAKVRTERDHLAKQLQEMDTVSGLDPFSVINGEHTVNDMHDRLIEALDSDAAHERSARMALDYYLEHMLSPTEEEGIQKERQAKHDAQVAKGGLDIEKKLDPEKMTKRLMELTEEIDRLSSVRLSVPQDLTGRVREVAETLNKALNGPDAPPVKQPRKDKVKEDLNKLDRRIKEIESEVRDLTTDAVPEMLKDEYGIRKVLDRGANLALATNRPKGSYVKRVSDFLDRVTSVKGVNGIKEVINRYHIRPPDNPHADLLLSMGAPADAKIVPLSAGQLRVMAVQRRLPPDHMAVYDKTNNTIYLRKDVHAGASGSLMNHVYDVASKVIGDTEVVVLTPEQMQLAASQRGFDDGPPAFYDPKSHRIFISRDVMNGPDRNRVLSHEIIHPLSEVAIEHFPEIGKRLDAIRLMLQKEWMKPYSQAGEIMGYRTQGLENVHEFLSEFFNGSGELQRALATIEPSAAERAGFKTEERQSLLMRTLKSIRDGLFKLFLHNTHKTALSDAIVASLDLFKGIESVSDRRGEDGSGFLRPKGDTPARPIIDWREPPSSTPTGRLVEDTQNWVKDSLRSVKHAWSRFDGRTGVALYAQDLSQQARRFEPGMQAHVEEIRKALTHSFNSFRRITEESGAEKIGAKMAEAQRRSPKAWDRFEDYIDRENQAGVSGSEPIGVGLNAHISPTSKEHAQFRADHAELARDYASMPVPFKEVRKDLIDFYPKRHNDIANAQIEQLIDLRHMATDPVTRSALVKYIRDKPSVTAAERTRLERNVPGFSFDADRTNRTPEYKRFQKIMGEIRGITHLRKTPGIWYPKFRKGDWVVEGHFNTAKHAVPAGGVELKNDEGVPVKGTWDFTSEQARDRFTAAMARDPVLKKIKFQELSEHEDDAGTKTYRAKYNPLQLEFFEKQDEAFAHHADLKRQFGDDIDMMHVQPRRDDGQTYLNPMKADSALRSMMTGLKRSEGWADLDHGSQARLEADLNETAIRHIMSVARRATYLPRTYALGARKDILQDFMQYSTNTAYSLAEVRHRGETARAFKGADDYTDSMRNSGGAGDPQGKFNIGRQQLMASLHRRANYKPDPVFGPMWKKGIARILQASYMDKLASPMNWVLNATEPFMTGIPLLGGAHKSYFRAARAVLKAYSDLGIMKQYGQGFSDANIVRKAGIGGIPQMPDNPKRFKQATAHLPDAANIHKLVDYLEEYGHLDRDSSMELSRVLDPGAGRLGRTMDWADNVTRQISANIDNTNRVSLGIAAMRLALEDGKTIEQALAHAEKYVQKTVGNYAKYNEAEMFRHPALGPMMQFKRYAQRMTANWVSAAYQSFAKLEADGGFVTPEQRSIARHQLAYMMGTVTAVSGMLGLPTEPIKAVINAQAIFTGFNSDDAENWVRQRAADLLGDDLGYILTRGIPRYFDLGIGTRLGLDGLWTYGAPGNKSDSFYSSIGHVVGGAPLGYLVDLASGVLRLTEAAGNFARGETAEGANNLRHGVQQALPFKVATDVLEHIANYMGGPETQTRYGSPLGYQPTLSETVMGALGLRSGRSQEINDKRRAMSAERTDQTEARRRAYAMYVHADNKAAIRQQVLDNYNSRWPDEPITVGDLLKADQRYTKQIDTMVEHPEYAGLPFSAKQRNMLPQFSAYMTQ